MDSLFQTFVCPACRLPLTWSQDLAQCAKCGRDYPRVGGVPLFSPTEGGTTGGPSGLAEATFRNPAGYAFVVKAKRAIYQDARLGTEEYIRDRVVLDVGCGPNLDFEHLENHHSLARQYLGIDLSTEFAVAASRRQQGAKYAFAQGSAVTLPLADKSVDTSILSFTLHHVSGSPRRLIEEMMRVTRSTLIILDHLRTDDWITGAIQNTYWRLFDGGCNYLTQSQWRDVLRDLRVLKRVRTGAIFGHVIKFLCAVE